MKRNQADIELSGPPSGIVGVEAYNKPFRFPTGWAAIALLLYTLAITYGSLVPLNFQYITWDEALARFRKIQTLNLTVGKRGDLLANMFLCIPLSLFATLILSQVSRAIAWRAIAFFMGGLLGAAWGLSVEFLQLYFPGRTVSMNDMKAQIAGSVIGALAGFCVALAGGALLRVIGLAGKPIRENWGQLYVIALVAYSVFPCDFVISLGELRRKIDDGNIAIINSNEVRLDVTSAMKHLARIASFIPIGFFAGRRRIRVKSKRGDVSALPMKPWVSGVLTALLIEVLQLPIYSRMTSATPLLYGAIGAILGDMAQRYEAKRNVEVPQFVDQWLLRLALPAYIALIFIIMLAPFQLADEAARQIRWHGLFSVPFAKLYQANELDALTNVLQKSLIFAVFGVLCSPWLHAGQPPSFVAKKVVVVFFLGMVLGTSVELSQVFIAAHDADITDILIYAVSAPLGYWISAYFISPSHANWH